MAGASETRGGIYSQEKQTGEFGYPEVRRDPEPVNFVMEEFTEFDRPFGLCKLDAELLKSFNSTLKDLRGLILSNIEFYQRGRSALHARFYASFCILLERSQILEPLVFEIIPNLCRFDFSEEVPGNGYRSFMSLIYRCCLYLLQLCRHIHTSKASLFFQSARYCKDLECYVETLGQLTACLHYLKQLMSYCTDGELFLLDDSVVGDSLLLQLEMINTDCFYGRCVGFQFSQSIQKALQAVMVLMATFSECYEEPSQVMQIASSLLNSGKYVIDQELRARQVVNITRTGDIKFCKAFWSLPESPILAQLLSFTYPYVEVSDVISLDPVNFELPSTCSEETVTITPPCAHTGPAPVHVRLISHALREGQDSKRKRFKPKSSSSKSVVLPQSSCLLFHCHGGGFVSQSSKSHESYLRTWALELEVPILSVDYSLAPDLPFPRALEECFYAYAWALKNPSKLGWTGERVCFAGDSAGANLVISTALRAVYFEIRVPDGIMSAYAPVMIQYTPSPARFMSMIDPLLPVGILMRCLAAYAGIADELSSALAKPIFCNPGNVETWEMVDSTDAPHVEDYVGEVPNNLDSISDGAENMHVIDSNTTQSDISINPEEGRNSTINGCETRHESKNDFSAVHKADEESKLPVHYVSDGSSDSDCMIIDETFETVIVDSDMVPIDVQTNEQHSSKSFTSSRLFNYIKKDNPVKSFVSGFKSLLSKTAKNQTTNKGQTSVESNSATKKQEIGICDSEQISTDNSNCTEKTDQSTQETVKYNVSGSVQNDMSNSLEDDEQTECNTKMANKHDLKCGADTHENNDKLNELVPETENNDKLNELVPETENNDKLNKLVPETENDDKLNELVPETENNDKLNELVPETVTSSFSLSLFSTATTTTTTTTGCDINTPVSDVDSKRSIDVSDHDKENPVAPKMENVTESLLDNINSPNGADVSDDDKENPVAPKMANVTESLLDSINSRNGADVSDLVQRTLSCGNDTNVSEQLQDNGSHKQCSDATEVVDVIGGSNKATDTTLDLKPAPGVDCKNIETDSTEKNELSVKGATFNETNQFPDDYKSETTESFEEMSENSIDYADSGVKAEPSCQKNGSKTLVDTSGCLTSDSLLEGNGMSDIGNINKEKTSVIDDMTDSEAGDDIESEDTETAEDMETFALSLDTNNGYKEQTLTIECPELKGTKNMRTFEHDGTRNEVDDDHQSVENDVNSVQLPYEKINATSTESVSDSLESSVQNDYLPAKLNAESVTGTAEPPSQDQCTFKLDTEASSVETSYQNPTDPSELYAVCQELLDTRHCYDEYIEDYNGAHYQHLLKESSSCHSLEDRNSFLFDGDNRRLSIHSDGSCNSIEDSNAWITGDVIDLSEVDLSDIVTVIPDEQLGVEQKFKTTNGSDEKFDESVISAKALITDSSNISSDTAKFHLVDTENSLNHLQTARIDEPDLLVSETWKTKTSDSSNISSDTAKFHLVDAKTSVNHVQTDRMDEPDLLETCKTKTSDGENVIPDITKQMSVSQNSDSGFQGDSECTADKPRKRKDDAFSSLPDPIDITDSNGESNKVVGAINGSQRKHSRRTMSLDLTHTQSSVPDMYSLSPNNLSLPKSSTMPDNVNEQLTKTARIPRSSTVPELLSGCVTPKLFSIQRNITQSPIQLFRKLPIVKNPFMSPFLAPDDMLQGLPEVHLVACHFDPLLDDSVMFARRLKRLDKNVDLHIFDNLPHGFLNFASASPEAKKAMYYCIDKIKEVLNIETKTS